MSTGVPELDEQHRQIIASINNLHEAMLKGQGRDELGKTLSFLASYAAMHFSREEAEMTRSHCPAAALNQQGHRTFVGKVSAFQERLAREGASAALVLELKRDLADWLNLHIVKVDCQLLASAGAARRAA